MTLRIELADELEEQLARAASRRGLPLPDYAAEVLVGSLRPERAVNGTGAAALERLREAGFVGMWADRADLPDSPEYARLLRAEAERR